MGGRDHRPRWRDAAAEHAQHRHCHRRPSVCAAHPGHRGGRLPDLRYPVEPARVAAPAGRPRRRADRFGNDPGLCPPRLAGDAGGNGSAPDDPGRPGSIRTGRAPLCRRRDLGPAQSPRQAVPGRGRRKDPGRRTRRRRLRIPFDAVLVAVGRAANLKGYGLEELGIPTGRTVETNEFLQTRYPNIYAAGDVAGPFQFTHTAAHQAWYAAVNALFAPFKKFKADYSVIPWSTFVEPEVARVGLNELEAREKEHPLRSLGLSPRRPRPGDRRWRGARFHQGADRPRQGSHPRRHHRRRTRR
jgi:hypothetical protein